MTALLDKARKLAEAGKASVIKGAKTFKTFPAHSQVGLTMSATGLALGVNNYAANRSKLETEQQRVELDQKSLSALNKIHNALTKQKLRE